MGIRVYQLAKDLNTESKTIIQLAKEEGFELTSHMATIEPDVAQLIEEKFGKAKNPATSEASKKIKKPEKPEKKKEKISDKGEKSSELSEESKIPSSEEDKKDLTKSIKEKNSWTKSKKAPEKTNLSETAFKESNTSPSLPATTHPKMDTLQKSASATVVPVLVPSSSKETKTSSFDEKTHAFPSLPSSASILPQEDSKTAITSLRSETSTSSLMTLENKEPKTNTFEGKEKIKTDTKESSLDSKNTYPKNLNERGPKNQENSDRGKFSGGAVSVLPKPPVQNKFAPQEHRPFVPRPNENRYEDRRFRNRPQKTSAPQQPIHQREKKTEISLPITLKDLSMVTGVKSSVIIKLLMDHNILITINDVLSKEQVEMIALELGWDFVFKEKKDVEEQVEELYSRKEEDPSKMVERAPVVTMMGHVDHGKTTLLDKIRSTNVAAVESGGITQHIRAYKVSHTGKSIVFLDTPGHEAFTKMRARGANITDIVILVVAANDGVMPTTEEAIAHAKAGNVKIIVAINKVDLPEANTLKVKQQLSDKGIVPEEWGGEVGFVEVSAKTGKGIEALLERILLEAEVMELKAIPTREASGHVIEAKKDPDKGILVDILVQEGTLHRGDVVLVGNTYGRIKNIINHLGSRVNSVAPSTPVQVSGIIEIPKAGDRFIVMESLEETKKVIEERQRKAQETKWSTKKISHTSFADFLSGKLEHKVLRLIIKADAQGSLEVLSKSFLDLGSNEVKVEIIHQAVGGIIESDVDLADASDAIIIGFRVVCDDMAQQLARHKNIDLHIYQVIYKAIEELKSILIGMYDPEEREETTAELEVLQTFKISRTGTIAGCRVKKGTIERKHRVRLARDNIIIYDGRLASLKHFQEDVASVKVGLECGLKIENYDDIQVGDRVFAYKVEKHKRQIEL